MSIISQIGVVILIAFIVLVLIRSNKNLKKASEEGENFVDEWALRQEKKEEIKQKREEKKLEVQKEKEEKKLAKKQRRKGIPVQESEESIYSDRYEDESQQYFGQTEGYEDESQQSFGQSERYQDEADRYFDKKNRSFNRTDDYRDEENEYPDWDNQNRQEKTRYSDAGWDNQNQGATRADSWDDAPGYDGESLRVNTDWLYDYEEKEKQRQAKTKPEQYTFTDHTEAKHSDKIVPMKKRQTTGITLMKLDANHRVMARYRVNQIPFTIGRSANNNLVLDDLCVARNHCRIVEKDGRYVLEDVGTMNKLYVNGMMTSQVPLSDGVRVYIGNEEFQIEVEGGRSQSTRLYKNAEGSYE